jgi:alpha-N-arabinofuranosidase
VGSSPVARRRARPPCCAARARRPLPPDRPPPTRASTFCCASRSGIAPEIYGHFAEHLGAVIHDGVWVGERSKIPHVGGIRKALVEALRRLKPAVIRWPGGCFADSYNWRDGVGPRASRPRHTNFWAGAAEWQKPPPDGPSKYEDNVFGTNELVRFCRLVGAQPYLAVNLRSGSARDFDEWAEYCNGAPGTTTPADLRVASGERAPFNVRYWGVGNESWGCGGNFRPEEYAAEFRRFTERVPGGGVPLAFVAAGPGDNNLDWTRRFFGKLGERHSVGRVWGWSLHHYAWNVSGGRTSDWQKGKGDAIKYSDEEWYELLRAHGLEVLRARIELGGRHRDTRHGAGRRRRRKLTFQPTRSRSRAAACSGVRSRCDSASIS